jgi:Na+/glutamate symporter
MPDFLKVDGTSGALGLIRRLSGSRRKSDVGKAIATLGFGAGVLGGASNVKSTLINRKAIASGVTGLFSQEKTFKPPDKAIRSVKTEEESSTTIIRTRTRPSTVSYLTLFSAHSVRRVFNWLPAPVVAVV